MNSLKFFLCLSFFATISIHAQKIEFDLSKVRLESSSRNLLKVFGKPTSQASQKGSEYKEFKKKIGVESYRGKIAIYTINLNDKEDPWLWVKGVTNLDKTGFKLIKKADGSEIYESKNKKIEVEVDDFSVLIFSRRLATLIKKQ